MLKKMCLAGEVRAAGVHVAARGVVGGGAGRMCLAELYSCGAVDWEPSPIVASVPEPEPEPEPVSLSPIAPAPASAL